MAGVVAHRKRWEFRFLNIGVLEISSELSLIVMNKGKYRLSRLWILVQPRVCEIRLTKYRNIRILVELAKVVVLLKILPELEL